MASKTYNIFISHSWSYGDAYEKLTGMLDEASGFMYKNYSVPKDDPIHDADNAAQLRAAIKDKMQHASVVLVMAGKYSTYSKWINEEIAIAAKGFSSPKPLLGIEAFGAQQVSSTVRDAADELVKWQSKSIVQAIRNWG